ncbi:MAG: hypothetical protein AAFZ07_29555, partial [Actinomycetota bacterium]
PPINILDCEVRKDGAKAAAWTAHHGPIELGSIDIVPGDHQIAVRPHDFRLSDKKSNGAAKTQVRMVENHGVEHIAYCGYGDSLVSVAIPAGKAQPGDERFLGL